MDVTFNCQVIWIRIWELIVMSINFCYLYIPLGIKSEVNEFVLNITNQIVCFKVQYNGRNCCGNYTLQPKQMKKGNYNYSATIQPRDINIIIDGGI